MRTKDNQRRRATMIANIKRQIVGLLKHELIGDELASLDRLKDHDLHVLTVAIDKALGKREKK